VTPNDNAPSFASACLNLVNEADIYREYSQNTLDHFYRFFTTKKNEFIIFIPI
jgi:hypothetical protein